MRSYLCLLAARKLYPAIFSALLWAQLDLSFVFLYNPWPLHGGKRRGKM
jgi:hypothetical protein